MSGITIDDALTALTGELESIDEQVERLTERRGHVQAAADALAALDGMTRTDPVPPPVVERTRQARQAKAPAQRSTRKASRDEVLAELRKATAPVSTTEIATALDADTKTVSNRLTWLEKSGHVTKPGAGLWQLADRTPAPLRSVPDKPEPSSPGPGAVPLGGPIGRTPVDHDQARRAAGDAV